MKLMSGLDTLILLRATTRLAQMYPVNGSWGILATVTPNKQEKNEFGEMRTASKEMINPITAYSRPPPLPPGVGPLISLLLWWNSGSDDDGK